MVSFNRYTTFIRVITVVSTNTNKFKGVTTSADVRSQSKANSCVGDIGSQTRGQNNVPTRTISSATYNTVINTVNGHHHVIQRTAYSTVERTSSCDSTNSNGSSTGVSCACRSSSDSRRALTISNQTITTEVTDTVRQVNLSTVLSLSVVMSKRAEERHKLCITVVSNKNTRTIKCDLGKCIHNHATDWAARADSRAVYKQTATTRCRAFVTCYCAIGLTVSRWEGVRIKVSVVKVCITKVCTVLDVRTLQDCRLGISTEPNRERLVARQTIRCIIVKAVVT